MRTEYVKNSEELNREFNEYMRAGYKLYTRDGLTSARVEKKHKVSAGWCIFWLILGVIIGFFIYLIYCAAHAPIDDVNIVVGEAPNPDDEIYIYCANCKRSHPKSKGNYCPYCGADCSGKKTKKKNK